MAVTLTTVAKSASMTGLRDNFAGGTLEVLSASDVLLVTYSLTATGGSVAGGVWTVAFNAATVAAVATGTATKAQFKTSGGVADITGLTVAESGSDIILDDATVTAAQNITISTLTISHD